MYRFFVLLFILILYNTAISQKLSVYDIDISNFPIIKAKFLAYDKDGNHVRNLSTSDFEIKENGKNRVVTIVDCPPTNPPEALSSVLVLDASGSMSGKNLLIAKAAARAWVLGLMNQNSECAITSFESRSNILTGFTKDKDKLLNIIDLFKQNPSGFTNYDDALINSQTGALNVALRGEGKKVIVFLTDGQPTDEPKVSDIINFANKYNIIIYTVTIKITAPQSLIDIAEFTGGKWFELIKTEEQGKKIYSQILEKEQGSLPCELVWQSELSCVNEFINTEIKLVNQNISDYYGYQIPSNGVMRLDLTPQSLSFLNAKPGVKVDKFITLTARNADFNVLNITSSNPAFTVSPTTFTLKKNQNIDLTVSFIPPDSGYISSKFEIMNDRCATSFNAVGGFPGKHPFIQTLKVIKPNGGEIFPVGLDTIITWDGVLPEEKVRLEYSTNNGKSWHLITDNATGLKYKWTVPNTPSKNCIARVTTKDKYHGFDDDWILITNGKKKYWMGRYEVTQKQYYDIMLTNPSIFKGDSLPVEQLSWFDAIQFCNRLSDLNGLKLCYTINGTNVTFDATANGYRLPTEAEWEFACRANTFTHTYNGNIQAIYSKNCGLLSNELDKIGWYCSNSGGKTHPVGSKSPNNFGLYDMSGNVYEWVWDWYDTTSASERVLRGGSWNSFAENCKSAYRHFHFPNYTSNEFGFRLVKNY